MVEPLTFKTDQTPVPTFAPRTTYLYLFHGTSTPIVLTAHKRQNQTTRDNTYVRVLTNRARNA